MGRAVAHVLRVLQGVFEGEGFREYFAYFQ